jgi:electron transport complex protein RnfA
VLKGRKMERTFSAVTAYDGLAAAALFVTLNLAESFFDAALLALGFALGILASLLILAEIRRRASMEEVPRFLRGSPLVLVSMGLLSLIFSSAAAILFRVLEAG